MIAKKFKFVNNNLMFIIKLLLTNFIEKKTHRHIAKSTGMNAIILLFLRERTNGKQFGCGHTPKFLLGRGPQKCLLGSLPRPGSLGQNVPKRLAASPPLLRRFFIYLLVSTASKKVVGKAPSATSPPANCSPHRSVKIASIVLSVPVY